MRERAAARRGRLLAILTTAQRAYDNPLFAYSVPATSDMAAAQLIGRWKAETGRTRPRDVRPARGDSMYHVDDMIVRIHWVNRSIERKS